MYFGICSYSRFTSVCSFRMWSSYCSDIYAKGSFNQSLYADGCRSDSLSAIEHLEHVQIHVKIEHAQRGELTLTLISPSGTQSDILSERPKDESRNGIDFTFMTVHNWGENPTGRWTLVVRDNARSEVSGETRGRLLSWSLTLYGIVGELENHHEYSEPTPTPSVNTPTKTKKKSEQAHRVDVDEIKHLMAQETVSSDSVKIVSKNEDEMRMPEKHESYRGQSDFDYLKRLFGLDNQMRRKNVGGGEHLKRVLSPASERDESNVPDADEFRNPRAGGNRGRSDVHSRTVVAGGPGSHSKYDDVGSKADVEMTDEDIVMLEEIIHGLEEVLDDEK